MKHDNTQIEVINPHYTTSQSSYGSKNSERAEGTKKRHREKVDRSTKKEENEKPYTA
jgi:hypothetical protein